MRLAQDARWKWLCLAALAAVAAYFLTFGRQPLNHFLEQLRQWGPVPFYAVFALLISLGVPPTPFLLMAGAAYDLGTNALGLSLAYAVSLGFSFFYASRLFRRPLQTFLAAKAPLVAGVLGENPVLSTVLIRLTPGFPYVLQNCLLASTCPSFVTFFFPSLPAVLAMAMLFVGLGRSLLAGNYAWVGLLLVILGGVLLIFRYIARHRAAKG